MTTVSAKELRENLSTYLRRSAAGEELEIIYRSHRIVRMVPAQDEPLYGGDQVGERLDKVLQALPGHVSPTLRDPARTYKQLRDDLYSHDPKYRRYLSTTAIDTVDE